MTNRLLELLPPTLEQPGKSEILSSGSLYWVTGNSEEDIYVAQLIMVQNRPNLTWYFNPGAHHQLSPKKKFLRGRITDNELASITQFIGKHASVRRPQVDPLDSNQPYFDKGKIVELYWSANGVLMVAYRSSYSVVFTVVAPLIELTEE